MRSIIVDSGPLIALFDGSDRYHVQAITFLKSVRHRLITNLPVITEVVYVLDFSPAAQRDFLYWAERALRIDQNTVADMPRIRSILEKYADLPADFADASVVALAERLRTRFVASVDKDFTIYRLRHKQHFTNLFFDPTNETD
jgi:predicted nucleic acid-binding protein